MRRLRYLLVATSCLNCSEPAAPSPPQSPPTEGGSGGGLPAGGSGLGGGGGAAPGAGATAGGSGAAAGGGGGDAQPPSGGSSGEGGSSNEGGDAGSAGEPAMSAAPGVTLLGETKLNGAGLSVVSYGGYLNGESFQQDATISHQGYQYAAFWNKARHVVVARRKLPSGAWESVELTDYTNSENDAHNTISLGVTPADGTLHIAFDHHDSPLHYRKSVAGLLTKPDDAAWSAASFGAVTSQLGGAAVKDFTYPRFVSVPGGEKTLLSARIGQSGGGDEYLWEYSGKTGTWASVGKYIDGKGDDINAYLHGLSYGPGTKRLHAAWCWRETSDASTNHDLLYAFSDDDGRTWRNDQETPLATTGSAAIHAGSAGLAVVRIAQKRGLINQEHLVVDGAGRVHVLLSHLPDAAADDGTFDSARTKSRYFHYVRESAGKWTRAALEAPAIAAFRGKLALSPSGNLYAVLPDLRIAGTSTTPVSWKLLHPGESNRFFSDPLVDATRVQSEGVLSVFYPARTSGDLFVVDFSVE